MLGGWLATLGSSIEEYLHGLLLHVVDDEYLPQYLLAKGVCVCNDDALDVKLPRRLLGRGPVVPQTWNDGFLTFGYSA